MRKGNLGSIVALLAAAGLVGAQPVSYSPSATTERSTSVDSFAANPAPPTAFPIGDAAPLPARSSAPGVSLASDLPARPGSTPGPPVLDAAGVIGLGDPEFCGIEKKTAPDGTCHGPHIWVNAEYLLWWVESGPLRTPLVTTGPLSSLGILGNAGTTVLFGNNDLNYAASSGGRITLGICEPTELIGVEANAFFLLRRSVNFDAASDAAGTPLLARPFFDTSIGRENVQLVAAPGAFAGNIGISSSTQMLGAEFNGILAVLGTCHFNVEAIAGFRYLDLDEDLSILKSSTILAGGESAINGMPLFAPSTTTTGDQFQTRNQFYGGQLGAQVEARMGDFYVDVLGKLAAGDTHEKVSISGSTTATTAGTSITVPGGLLALPSNIGKNFHDEFALIPEVQATLGYQMCKTIRVFVGYDFLYWSNVARPGEQIDRVVNASHIPTSLTFNPSSGPNEPTLTVHQSSMWVQGLHFGVTLRY